MGNGSCVLGLGLGISCIGHVDNMADVKDARAPGTCGDPDRGTRKLKDLGG